VIATRRDQPVVVSPTPWVAFNPSIWEQAGSMRGGQNQVQKTFKSRGHQDHLDPPMISSLLCYWMEGEELCHQSQKVQPTAGSTRSICFLAMPSECMPCEYKLNKRQKQSLCPSEMSATDGKPQAERRLTEPFCHTIRAIERALDRIANAKNLVPKCR
jgi:hypothetical protein